MRDLALGRVADALLQMFDVACEHAETVGAAVLVAAFEQYLQAHADAEEGFLRRGARERPRKPARADRGHAVAGGALSGEHDFVGVVDAALVAGDLDLRVARADAAQRALNRAQVAHAVIHNGDGEHRRIPRRNARAATTS